MTLFYYGKISINNDCLESFQTMPEAVMLKIEPGLSVCQICTLLQHFSFSVNNGKEEPKRSLSEAGELLLVIEASI